MNTTIGSLNDVWPTMSRKKSKLSADDKALFASWVKDVRPLKNKFGNKPVDALQVKKNHPNPSIADDEVFSSDWSDPHFEEQMLSHQDFSTQKNSGIQHQLFKKLKQGKIPIEARLDLHGYTIQLARSRISQFLSFAQSSGFRCVCVVHGKGTHNEHGKAVLKSMVHHWMKQAPEVLALCSALPKDGGTGALYILLKKNR